MLDEIIHKLREVHLAPIPSQQPPLAELWQCTLILADRSVVKGQAPTPDGALEAAVDQVENRPPQRWYRTGRR